VVTSGKLSFSNAKSPETTAEKWDCDEFIMMTWLWNMEQLISR